MGAITIADLQGQWTLVKCFRDCPPPAREYLPAPPEENTLIFDHDTIRAFRFPYVMLFSEHIQLDSAKLITEKHSTYASAQIDSGRLILHMRDCYTCIYRRDTFDRNELKTISILQYDTINPQLILGRLTMVTHFVPDDEAAYDFYPPIRMPSSVFISDTAQASAIIKKGIIYLKAGGKIRPFYVMGIYWESSFYTHRSEFLSIELPYLIVTPGNWWNGESFKVRYQMTESDWAKAYR